MKGRIIKEAKFLVIGDIILERGEVEWIIKNISKLSDKTLEFTLSSYFARIAEHRPTGTGLKRVYRESQHFIVC